MKMHVRKGDKVIVISGKDGPSSGKAKTGKVLTVFPKEGTVIVEGVNVATKHKKPRKQGDPAGIIKQEAPIHASKVMLVCNKCGKPTRVGRRILDDGVKIRYCKKCEESFD